MDNKINENELMKEISQALRSSGMMPNNKGFTYLKEAIYIAYSVPESVGTLSKLIYPEIAKKYGICEKSIDASISKIIKKTWDVTKNNEFYKGLGFQWLNRKPKNSEYIFMVVEYLNNL